MNTTPNIKPLSDAISSPIMKAYVKGGYGLTFLMLGSILMLIAYFSSEKGILSYIVLATGAIIIFSILAYFYFKDFRKLVIAKESVKRNKELIDAIQQTALEMTELSYNLQALIFKHADQVSYAIQYIRPVIRELPLVGRLADSKVMDKTETLSTTIVESAERIKKVIEDLEKALIESDPRGLKKYLEQVREFKVDIRRLLGETYVRIRRD
jgi:hypothetical protein